MFEFALQAAKKSRPEDLGNLSIISRKIFDELPTFRFHSQVPCLEYVSLLIENALLLRANREGRVYVGFERLSRMEYVADRFLRISDVSERVYVFGEPDWEPPRHPNMGVVKLKPETKLSREWFVIAHSGKYSAALVAVDEDGFSTPTLDERNFRAFKSTDPAIVARLADAAEDLIDQTAQAWHA
ncbi:MAG TPA: DICT sensory domain-containing protein [Pyrinomonadaceae bacterium]|nr:DICT sensory domain-containing protein [Pyrinomonadaceae bacterium]